MPKMYILAFLFGNWNTFILWNLIFFPTFSGQRRKVIVIWSLKFWCPLASVTFFFFFGSEVMLILYLDTDFALYCIRRQIRYSMNISCSLIFPNVAQRKIALSANFSGRLVIPTWLTCTNVPSCCISVQAVFVHQWLPSRHLEPCLVCLHHPHRLAKFHGESCQSFPLSVIARALYLLPALSPVPNVVLFAVTTVTYCNNC